MHSLHFPHLLLCSDCCWLAVGFILLVGLVAYLDRVTRIDENRFWTYHDPLFTAGGGKSAASADRLKETILN